MTKKEYILKLTNLIVNRVKFHSPRVDGEIDYALLDAVGIDGSYPIFMFNRKLDKIYYKAFLEAKKQVDFNLILQNKPSISSKKINKMPKTYLLFKEEMGSLLSNSLDSLNINYLSHSDFKINLNGEYLNVNGEKISFDYLPYFYYKKIMNGGVISDIKSYILNGKNYCLSFTNTKDRNECVEFEFNLPLPRGYYFFKHKLNCVEIENLTNKEKAYFNYNFKGGQFSFSTISGIESCTFACINLKCKINLLSKETKKVYFNFGDQKYCLNTPKEMQFFFELSQKKMNEIFDLRVSTRDNTFDNDFNLYLPRKIWEKWQNFDVDEENENKYIKMKKEIIENQSNGVQISRKIKGLKEVKFYRNNGWKRVFVLHNNSTYLFAGKVKYFNFTLLTKEIFDKNNEIYLSFAE